MFTDLTGKRRYKINLHCHSTRSDGRISYEEVLAAYARAGYDMLAVTDHRKPARRHAADHADPVRL